MKKFLIILILSLYTISQNINAAESSEAVSMVSYEQRWLDSNGTIALRNNTSDHVRSISFMLEYLDMNGNPMDYEEFTYNVDIPPGKTKKIDIPAYESKRFYHYYKTKDEFNNPAFKLRYELKDFTTRSSNGSVASKTTENNSKPRANSKATAKRQAKAKNHAVTEKEHKTHSADYSSSSYDRQDSSRSYQSDTIWGSVFMVIFIITLAGIGIGMYICVAVMAKNRHRSPAVWLLLSFIASPLLICIILFAIGGKYPQD